MRYLLSGHAVDHDFNNGTIRPLHQDPVDHTAVGMEAANVDDTAIKLTDHPIDKLLCTNDLPVSDKLAHLRLRQFRGLRRDGSGANAKHQASYAIL